MSAANGDRLRVAMDVAVDIMCQASQRQADTGKKWPEHVGEALALLVRTIEVVASDTPAAKITDAVNALKKHYATPGEYLRHVVKEAGGEIVKSKGGAA